MKRNLLILALLYISFTIRAQTSDPDKVITVQYTNTTLEEVLKDITSLTGIKFSYSPQAIPLRRTITYTAENTSTQKILTDIFKQVGIHYEIVGNYMVLKKNEEEVIVEEPPPVQYYTLSGYITDSTNSEVLIGAAIYHKETGRGVLSNNYGFFSLTLPEGTYNIEASYLGYKIAAQKVTLTSSKRWNVHLSPAPAMVEEVVITSFNQEEHIFSSLAAQTNIEASEVKQQSAALGETDMLKTLANLPGISFHNEGSSYFYVRGGNSDQNLIILDEATIYHPSHLLGLFTPIIPDAVKHTEVYKADFPIQYGGRLSSVIDIRTRDGNMQKFSGSANIGLVSNRYSIEGPLKKKSSSYFLAYRRSHFGFLVKKAAPSIQDFYFTDLTAKFNIKLGEKDRLLLTIFSGKDIFLQEEDQTVKGLEWSNSSLTLRWNHIYGNKLFSNVTFYTSTFDYFLHTDYDENLNWNSHVSSTNLKTEFTYYYNPKNNVKFGVNFGGYGFNPGNYNHPDLSDNLKVSAMTSTEATFYLGNEQEITDWFYFHYGIRTTSWANYGESFIVDYNDHYTPIKIDEYEKGEKYYKSNSMEPRLSLSFKTSPFSSIKASYNHTVQNINVINNSISPFNSLEVWLPAGPNIKPQHANIFNLGFVKSWPNQFVDISADVFYKRMTNQIGYSYHAQMLLNPYLEGELRQGDGTAYGFEIMLKKSMGQLSGHLAYGYSRSFLQIDGLNLNRRYNSHQDRPVDITFLLNYQAKPRWLLSLNMVYTSGMCITTPTGFYYYRGEQVPIYTKQNNDRLPDYKRVDVSISIRLNKLHKPTVQMLNISIYNFFNYQNPAFLNFNKIAADNGEFLVPADLLNHEDLVVTKRFIYSFIPSISYSISF